MKKGQRNVGNWTAMIGLVALVLYFLGIAAMIFGWNPKLMVAGACSGVFMAFGIRSLPFYAMPFFFLSSLLLFFQAMKAF